MGHALPRLQLAVQPLALGLELVIGLAELCYSLLRKQFFQRPLLNVLLLVLLELRDEVDGALEDGSLVLLASRYYLGELVDALIDVFSTASFN